ncbi:anti-sigma factor antagonist [Chlamydiifrater volucris]|uniref:anti-sigma factor antagonist n=1 Tax=Chlamydiifrater volucris TaxID=2681470 RepID=UPI001BCFAEC1|nr:anti-sigma factor antagonist [Chlamydiifrater volucris]
MSDIRKETHGDTTVFFLEGKLDGVSSPSIQKTISEEISSGTKNIVLECSKLEYMSSAGIRVLLQSYHQAGKNSGKIVLTTVSKTIEQTLYVTGFLSYFHIYASLEDALSSLNQQED